MKLTRNRINLLVSNTKLKVVNKVHDEKAKEILDLKIKFWRELDKDGTRLKAAYKSKLDQSKIWNKLIDDVDDLKESGTLKYSHGAIRIFVEDSFEKFEKNFCERLVFDGQYERQIKKLENSYQFKIDEVRSSYSAITENLKNLSPKKGVEYLEGLGFDVSSLTKDKESNQLPMKVVDKTKLGLPLEPKEQMENGTGNYLRSSISKR